MASYYNIHSKHNSRRVTLNVHSYLKTVPIHNVLGMLKGSIEPGK